MRLFIDNKQADIDSRSQLSISLSIGSVSDFGKGRTGYSRTVTIPMTPRNRAMMGNCEEVHARDRFNDSLHEARVEFSGFTVMEGVAYVTECCNLPRGTGYYKFNIIGSARLWARHAASNPLYSLFPESRVVMSQESIVRSWTEDSLVKYLPVQRDIYNTENLQPRELGMLDYHPFFNIRRMLTEIFRQAGYTIESHFLESPMFGSLFMSGNLGISYLTSAQENEMDFRAGRFANATAVADANGRVFADPHALFNTVGNIVDTADPDEVYNGRRVPGVYDRSGCFGKIDGRVAFKPSSPVTAGFRYEFTYLTQFKFYSPQVLLGFDKIYLGNDQFHEAVIRNPYQDRRKRIVEQREYKLFIRSLPAQAVYCTLKAFRITNPNADRNNLRPGDYQIVTICSTVETVADVITDYPGEELVNLHLTARTRSGEYTFGDDEWMLADSYVDANGKVEVTTTVESVPQTITPSSPKYFDSIYFAGNSSQGMEFTIKDAFISPVFESGLEHVNLDIPFADAVPAQMSRMDLIDALRQMFNLCFYTDNIGKKVFIEPRSGFFNGPRVDWSDRADHSKPYILQELGEEAGKRVTLRYKDEDGAVSRRDKSAGDIFGSWDAQVDNLYASSGNTVIQNPVFSPSLNISGVVAGALSASLPNVGDRDRTADKKGGLDFPSKVVGYAGMVPLAAGETWPQSGPFYPLTAFHAPEQGFSLCFEDRDGADGLHSYWETDIEACNSGRRLTMWMRLGPHDIEAIVKPNSLRRDFRACYLLRIEGEDSLWRLEQVCDYNPANPSTKCVFVRIPQHN